MADTKLKAFYLPDDVIQSLELFRQDLQRTSPYRVTNSNAAAVAVRIAVASMSAAIATGQPVPGLQPPQDRPPP